MLFSEEEKLLIARTYNKNKAKLDSKSKKPDHLAEVNEIIRQLTDRINATASTKKSVKQVRKFVQNLLQRARRKLAFDKRDSRRCSGNGMEVTLTAAEHLIINGFMNIGGDDDQTSDDALQPQFSPLPVATESNDVGDHNYRSSGRPRLQKANIRTSGERSSAANTFSRPTTSIAQRSLVEETLLLQKELMNLQKEMCVTFNGMISNFSEMISEARAAIFEARSVMRGGSRQHISLQGPGRLQE